MASVALDLEIGGPEVEREMSRFTALLTLEILNLTGC